MRVVSFAKKTKNTKSKTEVEELIKKKRKEGERLVKGEFEFTDAEGGFFEFIYKVYPGTPVQKFTLIHGEICEIPLELARHLNGTKQKISRYKNVEQSSTGPIRPPRTVETKSRVRFITEEVL